MTFRFADRIRDTTTTTGTGAVTVSGTAPTGYLTFSAVPSIATNDTLPYFIAHQTLNEWEVGLGTYSAANQITRTTVISSSNAGSAVTFSAGTKDVVLSLVSDAPTMGKWLYGGDPPQSFYIYNSGAAPTNYERGAFDFTTNANSLTIGTQKGGTGTARDVILTAASNTIFLSSGCNFRMQGAGAWAYFLGTAANGGGIFLNGGNFFGSITTNDNITTDFWSLGKASILGSNSPTAALSWNFPASGAGNVIVGTAAIGTTATDGFLYISTCAGTPTGTPTTFTGRVPMVYDTTNNKFYIYNGSWKGGTVPGTFS
jgi:hypothetical protein